MNWTKPCCRVQHLDQASIAGGVRQITVEDHGTFAEVYALGFRDFKPIWHQTHKTIGEARAAGEAYAASFATMRPIR